MSSLVAILFLSLVILGDCSPHTMSKEELGLRTEKLSHFHFYAYDIFGRPNSTDINVAQRQDDNTTTTQAAARFGTVNVVDAPLRVSANIRSKQIGSMEGIVVAVSLADRSTYSMLINIAFTKGEYNGSTLVMLGRNQANLKTREMPILGGSGSFRFARGYALTSTYFRFDPKTGLSIFEYDLYVLHY